MSMCQLLMNMFIHRLSVKMSVSVEDNKIIIDIYLSYLFPNRAYSVCHTVDIVRSYITDIHLYGSEPTDPTLAISIRMDRHSNVAVQTFLSKITCYGKLSCLKDVGRLAVVAL